MIHTDVDSISDSELWHWEQHVTDEDLWESMNSPKGSYMLQYMLYPWNYFWRDTKDRPRQELINLAERIIKLWGKHDRSKKV